MTNIQSSDVSAGQPVLAAHYNNLRGDIVDSVYTEAATAGESINSSTNPQAVYFNSSDSKYYKCDGDDSTKLNFVGFDVTGASSAANDSINIQRVGLVRGFASLTVGSKYYLDHTAGAISANPGDYNVLIGVAVTSTTLLITYDGKPTYIPQSIGRPFELTTLSSCATYVDDINYVISDGGGTTIRIWAYNKDYETRNTTSDYAAADNVNGMVKIGAYVYSLLWDAGLTTYKLYRYAVDNLAGAGTEMTGGSFGTNSGATLFSDGTYLYFTKQAGNTANQYDIRRYTISGTTIGSASDFALSDSASLTAQNAISANSRHIFITNSSNNGKKYTLAGTLELTTTSTISSSATSFHTIGDYLDRVYHNVGTGERLQRFPLN